MIVWGGNESGENVYYKSCYSELFKPPQYCYLENIYKKKKEMFNSNALLLYYWIGVIINL